MAIVASIVAPVILFCPAYRKSVGQPKTLLMNYSRLYKGGLIACVVLAGSALTGIGIGDSIAAGKSNGVASKTPTQILNAAQAALKSAHSYVLTAEIKQSGSTMGVKLIDGGARNELGMTMGQSSADIILASGHAYMQANASFWKNQAKSPAAAVLAGRWIEVPDSTFKGLLSDLGSLEPSQLADCLSDGPHGAITKVGTTTVGDAPVVVLKDAGNVPGDGPGTIAIATTGPAYPLQIVQTGPTRAGGKVDACNDGKGDDSTGTMTLDDYDHAPTIKIPIDPLKLPSSSSAA
jgi:hypothetical protein